MKFKRTVNFNLVQISFDFIENLKLKFGIDLLANLIFLPITKYFCTKISANMVLVPGSPM